MTVETHHTNSYKINDILSFNENVSIQSYLLDGWSGQESKHRWTNSSCASLHFYIKELNLRKIILRVQCCGYLAGGKLDHQLVEVLVNGSKVATWEVREVRWYEADIPHDLLKIGDLKLDFYISNPTSPYDSNLSMDTRKLGLCVFNLEFLDYQIEQSHKKVKVIRSEKNNKDKKFYTVYGNCQVVIIAKYLNSCPLFSSEYEYIEIPAVYDMTPEKFSESKVKASRIALFIFQEVHSGAYPSKDIVAQLPVECELIKLPSLFFQGYNPEMAYLRQTAAVLFYHDRIMLQHICDFDRFKHRLLIDENFFPLDFSKDCVDASLNELKKREHAQKVDIKITDFIAENYKKQRLFHVMNHPTAALIKEVTLRILKLFGFEGSINEQIPIGALDKCQYPIYRSHFLNLELDFQNPPSYIQLGQILTVEKFFPSRKSEYEKLDLEFAKQDIFSFSKPIIKGQDMASGLQF